MASVGCLSARFGRVGGNMQHATAFVLRRFVDTRKNKKRIALHVYTRAILRAGQVDRSALNGCARRLFPKMM